MVDADLDVHHLLTGLLKGDHLDKLEVEDENAKAEARGGRAAITEQSARVRAAIQQAFDSAEASLQR